MNKCPECGHSPNKETFHEMMDRVLRESGEKLEKETGYGIPDKKKDTIKFNKPKTFKGELDHVKRNN